MKIKDVIKSGQNGKTVYYVGGIMFEPDAFPAKIISIRTNQGAEFLPEAEIVNIMTKGTENLSINEIDSDENSAIEHSLKMQKSN